MGVGGRGCGGGDGGTHGVAKGGQKAAEDAGKGSLSRAVLAVIGRLTLRG